MPNSQEAKRHAPEGFPKTGGSHRPHTLHWFDGDLGLMIWSAPGHGFWIVCKKKQITIHALSYEAAWTKFIQALDPEIEAVKFDKQRMVPPVFRPTRPFSHRGSVVLGLLLGFLLALSTATLGVSLLLRPVVRTGFQFVGFAGEAVEVKDFLSVLTHWCGTSISNPAKRIASPHWRRPWYQSNVESSDWVTAYYANRADEEQRTGIICVCIGLLLFVRALTVLRRK